MKCMAHQVEYTAICFVRYSKLGKNRALILQNCSHNKIVNFYFNDFRDGNNQQLGGCLRDFRNRPNAVRAKIRYYNNILTVFYHGGMTNKDEDYELCMRAENVHLPKQGFFGVTAATGGLAGNTFSVKM